MISSTGPGKLDEVLSHATSWFDGIVYYTYNVAKWLFCVNDMCQISGNSIFRMNVGENIGFLFVFDIQIVSVTSTRESTNS